MGDASLDPFEAIIGAYWSVYLELQRPAIEEWLGLRDVSLAQLRVLLTLHIEGAMTMGGLADSLGVGLPTASHLVERLVRAGWVERAEAEEDRRVTRACLTQEGAELIGRLREDRQTHFKAWLVAMSDTDRDALLRGLTALERVAHKARSL